MDDFDGAHIRVVVRIRSQMLRRLGDLAMKTKNMEPQFLENAANILTLVANANRIRMLKVMLDREISVGQLANEVGLTQSAASQHLVRLISSGLVMQRKSQQTRFCCVYEDRKAILRRLINIAEEFDYRG